MLLEKPRCHPTRIGRRRLVQDRFHAAMFHVPDCEIVIIIRQNLSRGLLGWRTDNIDEQINVKNVIVCISESCVDRLN